MLKEFGKYPEIWIRGNYTKDTEMGLRKSRDS